MQFKSLLYYILVWLLPVLSAVAAFFVDSIGLGITLIMFSISLLIYTYFYLKSIKIKIKDNFLVVFKGKFIKQSFLTPKEKIICIKTVVFKIIKARSLIIIAPNLKIFIPFLKTKQIDKITEWYKEK